MSRTKSASTTPSFAEAAALCIGEAQAILNLLKIVPELTPEEVRDETVDHLVGMVQDLLDDVINLPVGEDYGTTPLAPYAEDDE